MNAPVHRQVINLKTTYNCQIKFTNKKRKSIMAEAAVPATENFADVHVGDVKLNEEVMPMTPETRPDDFESNSPDEEHGRERRLSLSDKVAVRVEGAGGTELVLCLTSSLLMIQAAREYSELILPQSESIYAIVVGATALALSIFLVVNNRYSFATLSDTVKLAVAVFFFLWFLGAIIYLSFCLNSLSPLKSSYTNLTTGYLALWGSGIVSVVMLQERMESFKSAVRKIEDQAERSGPPFFVIIFNIVILVEGIANINVGAVEGYATYAIIVGVLGAILGVAMIFLGDKLSGQAMQMVSLFLVVWQLVAVVVLTTGNKTPFRLSGNAFFALYGALIMSVKFVSINAEAAAATS